MGQIRTKQVKNQTYYYYSVRSRSRKKYGGSGKVKSIDFCLGRYIRDYGAIAYYVWNGDIKILDFIDAMIRYRFSHYLDQMIWTVDYKRKKIRLRSRRGSYFDARWSFVKYFRKEIEGFFDVADRIETKVAAIEQDYREYLESLETRKRHQQEAAKLQKKRDFETASFYNELAHSYSGFADNDFNRYKEALDKLLKAAPRSIRGEVRWKVEQRIERIKPRRAIA